MGRPLRILLIDDNPDDRILVVHELNREFPDLQVEQVTDMDGFTHALNEGGFDLVIVDYHLRWTDGLAVLRAVKSRDPDCPLIMFTATGNEEIVVEAMKSGLDDYVLKSPRHFVRLPTAVRAAVENARQRQERNRAEEALRQSEERYRNLVEGSIQGILVQQDSLIRYVNPAIARMFGYASPDEIIGRNHWETLVAPEWWKELQARAAALMRGEQLPIHSGWQGVRKDGTRIWVQSGASAITWQGRPAVLVFMVDITKRKQAEEALQQQLTRINLINQITRAVAERRDLESIFHVVLRRLEDHLPIDFSGVYFYDAPADTLKVLARGPRSRPLAVELGVPEGTEITVEQTGLRACVEGQTVSISDTAEVDASIPQALAQAGIRSLMATPLTGEGKTFGVLLAARRAVDGFSSAECEFLRVLSEHVALAAHHAWLHQELQQAYDDLRQTQRTVMQQERLRALGQMASGIAHDINNVLSPIVGYSEMLLLSEKNLSDRARQYLETIRTAGADIAHIVGRMREFYRQRNEQETLFPINLNHLVQQVIGLTRPRWRDIPQERGIVIEMQPDLQEELPVVIGMESELREALTNLIFNAVDAMPSGGRVTIRTRRDETAASPRPHAHTPPHVVVEVSDTGIGMDEETRRRCLEPFFSTKGERSTGLGLAMVYGVMQRHEGDIQIESAWGEGTTVRLIFPAREAPAAAQEDVSFSETCPLRVLCIDDEPLLRELLKEMLENDGHTVEVGDGGQTGLDMFRAARERDEPFDLVITDLGMPYVDGYAVARRVKQESPDTAVVLLTGWGTRMNAEGGIPVEVDAVLSKPPRVGEMRRMLMKVARRKSEG